MVALGVVVTPVTYIFEEGFRDRWQGDDGCGTGGVTMITIYDSPAAGARILTRRTDETVEDVPEVVLASIARVFGEPLTPEAAAARLAG